MYSNEDLERVYFQCQTEAVSFSGCRDFLSMTPLKISFAILQQRQMLKQS